MRPFAIANPVRRHPLSRSHVGGRSVGVTPLICGLTAGLLISFLLGMAPQAGATVIVPVPDEALVEQAVASAIGRVIAIESYWDAQQNQVFTHITLSLEEVLKGDLPSREVTIRQLGGTVGDFHSWVPGSPEFTRGERVLVFLGLNPDRTLRVAYLYQGKYSILADELTSEEFAYRETPLEGVSILGRRTGYDLHPLDEFKQRILAVVQRGLGAGRSGQADATTIVLSPSARGVTEAQARFTFLNPNRPVRLFEPDSNTPVTMLLNSAGEPAAPGSGFGQVRAGYQAWSTVTGANFQYEDGGFTSAVGFQADGVNAVSFRDPLDQMDSPVGCSGTLAIGGASLISLSQTRTVNGQVFSRILEGDLVFNDGLDGCGFYETFANFAEVAAHELGHVLGLGHSADPNATMAALAHFDGRGASLQTDDADGLRFIYPASIGVTPTSRDFGTVSAGSSAELSFTVQNTSEGTLTGSASTSAPFSIVSGTSFSLGAGQSQSVTVRFTPTAAGTSAGTVTFTSSGGTVTGAVTGTGAVPTVSIATDKSFYTLSDRMIVTVTTDPGGTTNSWYLLVVLVTPTTNTSDDPFVLYRFDPASNFLTFQTAVSDIGAAGSFDPITARPLQAVSSESLGVLDQALPLTLPEGFPDGSYTWVAAFFSQDLTAVSNVASAAFTVEQVISTGP